MASDLKRQAKEALGNSGPSKKLGQYFLIDKKAVSKIITAAEVSLKDTVLEIGPGAGALTRSLCEKAKKVVAVEKDPKMVTFLQKKIEGLKNLQIYHGDILSFNLQNLKRYKAVGNLPFCLANPAIRKFLESRNKPQDMTLLVQKELARRICAKPPKMNLLAVSVQFYASPKIISYVKKSSFLPQPKIDTAILKIKPDKQRGSPGFNDKFFRVAKAGFSQPRKQLANNLAKELKLEKDHARRWLEKSDISFSKRAEGLSIRDWARLAKTY